MIVAEQSIHRQKATVASGSFVDPLLLALYLALISIGTIAVFSATIALAYEQVIHVLIAGTVLLAVSLVPVRSIKRFAPVILGMAILLLAIVAVPGVGIELNGSRRWLNLFGLLFQPSEIAELGIVVFTASYLTRHQTKRSESLFASFPVTGVAVVVVAAALLLLEPDFGSSFVLGTTVVAMMFLSGVRKTHIGIIG